MNSVVTLGLGTLNVIRWVLAHRWVLLILLWVYLGDWSGSYLRAAVVLGVCLLFWRGYLFVLWRRRTLHLLKEANRPVPPAQQMVTRHFIEVWRLAVVASRWERSCVAAKCYSNDVLKRVPRVKGERWWQGPQATLDGDVVAYAQPGAFCADVEKFLNEAPKLAGYIRRGCDEVVVTKTGPGNMKVEFFFSNPLRRMTRLEALPVSPDRRMMVIGSQRDGSPILARKDFNLLLGGLPGSGKSNEVHMLIAQMLADGDHVNLYVGDVKGGMELPEYSDHVGEQQGRLKVVAYATTPAETVAMLAKAKKDMDIRRSWLSKQRIRKLTEPSANNPRCVVIIDELLLIPDILRKGTASDLGDILCGGRAALFTMWGATQDGRVESIPSSLRTLIQTRVCFAVDNVDSANCILGRGADKLGGLPHTLDVARDQGLFYAGGESDRIKVLGRAPYVSDSEVHQITRGQVPKRLLARGLESSKVAPHWLYRWWDDDPEFVAWTKRKGHTPGLVYVGETNNLDRREREHRRDDWGWCEFHGREENWFAEHAHRVTKVRFVEGKAYAKKQEEKAIHLERPVYNVKGNSGSAARRRLEAFLRKSVVDEALEVAVPESEEVVAQSRRDRRRARKEAQVELEPKGSRWPLWKSPASPSEIDDDTVVLDEPTDALEVDTAGRPLTESDVYDTVHGAE